MHHSLQFIIIISFFILNSSFKCGVDSIKKPKIGFISSSEDSKTFRLRRMAPRPIQIYIDYEILEKELRNNNINQDNFILLKSAFDYANDMFKKFLIVKNPTKISITKDMIDTSDLDFTSNDVPNLIKMSGSSEIDLYLVPYITDLGFGVDAAAFPLYLEGKSKRPILGFILLRSNYNTQKKTQLIFMVCYFFMK